MVRQRKSNLIDKTKAREAIDSLEGIDTLALQARDIVKALTIAKKLQRFTKVIDTKSKIKLMLVIKLLHEVDQLLSHTPTLVRDCKSALELCITRQDAIEEQVRLDALKRARQKRQ